MKKTQKKRKQSKAKEWTNITLSVGIPGAPKQAYERLADLLANGDYEYTTETFQHYVGDDLKREGDTAELIMEESEPDAEQTQRLFQPDE